MFLCGRGRYRIWILFINKGVDRGENLRGEELVLNGVSVADCLLARWDSWLGIRFLVKEAWRKSSTPNRLASIVLGAIEI